MTNIGFLHSRTSCLLACEWNRKRKRDFRDCGKSNPLNPPCQGDFLLNSPLIRGARGVRNDKYWFLAQPHFLLTSCEWNRKRKRDFRDCGKSNPLNPPCQGDFLLNSPLIRGARGVRNDECWIFAISLASVRYVDAVGKWGF